MQKRRFTRSEQLILSKLRIGMENAVTREELCSATGRCDRAIRKTISSLRYKGVEVMSSSSWRGYWLSSGREDKQEYVCEMSARGKKCIGVVKSIRKDLKKAANQKSIFEQEE